MTPQGALIELLGRVGACRGAAVLVNEDELSQWPGVAVTAMKSQRLLAKARPASSAICPGCERDCVMPVHTPPATGTPASFIVCDKRSDVNRVPVPISKLEQWQTTGGLIADALARLLGLSQPSTQAVDGGQWHIGLLKGKKYNSPVALLAGDNLTLSLAGHAVPLVDVLGIEKNALALDKAALIRLVDNPEGNGEDPEARRERIKARVGEEKAKGTKAFLKVVAEEEGLSVSRLKQLVAKKTVPTGILTGLYPIPKKTKPKY
ncbi:MAG: hypothetical protein ACYC2E_01215 [Sulfuricella sp.]